MFILNSEKTTFLESTGVAKVNIHHSARFKSANLSNQKYSVASAISSSSLSRRGSKKLEKPNEATKDKIDDDPVKLDDDGKVLVPSPLSQPKLGSAHVLTNSWTIWFMNRSPGTKIVNYLDATKQLETFSTVEEFWHIYTHLKRVDRLPFISEFQVFRKGVKPMWEDPVNADCGKWTIRIKRPFKVITNHNNSGNSSSSSRDFYSASAVNSVTNSVATTPTALRAPLATAPHNGVSTDGTATPTGLARSHSIFPSSLSLSQNANTKSYSHRPSNQARLQTRLFWEKLLLSIIGGELAKEANVDCNEITGAVMSVRKDEDILSVWTRSGKKKNSGKQESTTQEERNGQTEGNVDIRNAILKLLDLPETQVCEFKIHSESLKEGAVKQALFNNHNMLHSSYGSSTNLNNHNNYKSHYNSSWGSNRLQHSSNNAIGSPASLLPSSNSNSINTHFPRHHNNFQQLEATASILRSAMSPNTSPPFSSFPLSRSSSNSPSSSFSSASTVASDNNGSNSNANSPISWPISTNHKSIW